MIYPFITLDDEAEIVHSEMKNNGSVEVYIEKPNETNGFDHMRVLLPGYEIKDVIGFSVEEVDKYEEIVRSTAHLIMEFSQEGGLDNASGF